MKPSQFLLRFGGAFVVFCLATSLVASVQRVGSEARAARQTAYLAKYDLNGDGKVTRAERSTVKAKLRAEKAAAKAARKQPRPAVEAEKPGLSV